VYKKNNVGVSSVHYTDVYDGHTIYIISAYDVYKRHISKIYMTSAYSVYTYVVIVLLSNFYYPHFACHENKTEGLMQVKI